jgi:hypothetical protein
MIETECDHAIGGMKFRKYYPTNYNICSFMLALQQKIFVNLINGDFIVKIVYNFNPVFSRMERNFI